MRTKALFFLCIASLLFFGCSKEEESDVITYTVTTTVVGNGTITPSGTQTVTSGSSQTYTITPNEGYKVTSFTVNGVSQAMSSDGGTYILNYISSDKEISVTFSVITFNIIASSEEGGTITPSGTTLVEYGGMQTYTITPNNGYIIYSFTVKNYTETPGDGTVIFSCNIDSQLVLNSYTFEDVTENSTIVATFITNPSQSTKSAIIPMAKLEPLVYDWWGRHVEVLRIKDSINPEIVLIGNSIVHLWGGEPQVKFTDGQPNIPSGPIAWASVFGSYRVLNLGFGWDRTQNVLWRLDNGELDGLNPRVVVILIGTNNTSQTVNVRKNTAPEIVEGIAAVCDRVRTKTPAAKIILMAILPREQSPTHPRRVLINETNSLLAAYAEQQELTYLDLGPLMLSPNGTLPSEIASDFCHPTEKGYQIWADALRPLIEM